MYTKSRKRVSSGILVKLEKLTQNSLDFRKLRIFIAELPPKYIARAAKVQLEGIKLLFVENVLN